MPYMGVYSCSFLPPTGCCKVLADSQLLSKKATINKSIRELQVCLNCTCSVILRCCLSFPSSVKKCTLS